MIRYVLLHPRDGIYLGNAMGLGFWSRLDPVGQNAAVTFATPQEAIEHRALLKEPAAEVRPVECAGAPEADGVVFATIAECAAAGLPAWDPNAHPEPL